MMRITKKAELRKRKCQQGVMKLIKQNPKITMEEMAEKLDLNTHTTHCDIEELKNVIEYVGSIKGRIGVYSRQIGSN